MYDFKMTFADPKSLFREHILSLQLVYFILRLHTQSY